MNKLILIASVALATGMCAAATLEEDFKTPPPAARPYAWWYWVGGNVSREGIVRDLKAMREAGVGGVTILPVGSHGREIKTPGERILANQFNRSLRYRNDEWWRLVRCAAEEARRNGLDLGMQNCPGYASSGGPWITPDLAMKKVVWTKAAVTGGKSVHLKLAMPEVNFGWYRDVAVMVVPDRECGAHEVVDASAHMTDGGDFMWSAPAGRWSVYRIGCTCMTDRPHPAPEDVQLASLEADKLSARAMEVHMSNVIEPIRNHLGDLFGTTFRHILFDSYEGGSPNWTDDFREQFVNRRGYDPLPFLPSLDKACRIANASRFAEDMTLTAEELFTENHFALAHAWTRKAGVQLQLQPYGGPFDPHEAARHCDVPMREYWGFGGTPEVAGAVGRAYGRHVIATEAFAATPDNAAWTASPRIFKCPGDASFARGINRVMLHYWVHQPFAPQWKPGMTMGFWGNHFGENQTWHEPGKAWLAYLWRCQALLQRGEQVVDVLAFKGTPEASEFDSVPESGFLNDVKAAEDGTLRMPSGRTYRMMRFPDEVVVSPKVLEKLKELLNAGATVWCPRPKRAYGLQNHPAADARVAAIARELWGERETDAGERKIGKGRLFWGGKPEDALARIGWTPGARVVAGDANGDVMCAHRKDGDAQFFFAANTSSNRTLRTHMAFRVRGMLPEFWYPESGVMKRADSWREEGGSTVVAVDFRPQESLFVVFRKPLGEERPCAGCGMPKRIREIVVSNGWTVEFQKNRGAPEGTIALGELKSLSDPSFAPGIRHFSGTAAYRVELPVLREEDFPSATRWQLNLGDVRDVAEVTLNGKKLGVFWHSPYLVDVTGDLKFGDDGKNVLEVKVTNTWANRMIGDRREPEDCLWGAAQGNDGRGLAALPDFVLNNTERPSRGRFTFCIWDYFREDSPLLPSGLTEPVKIEVCRP